MKYVYIIILILSIKIVSADLIINEIMPNPSDNTYDEWIELYNNNNYEIDINNYIISDSYENDTILANDNQGQDSTIIPAYSYAIITDHENGVYNAYNVSDSAIKLWVNDDSIGNGFLNKGETIKLLNQNFELIDSVTYPNFDDYQDFTYAKINDSWLKTSIITPGYSNEHNTICDPSIDIIINDQLINNSQTIYFKPVVIGSFNNFVIDYWIEDLFGKKIKSKESTSSLSEKQFTPNIKESNKAVLLKANLTKIDCDYNFKNNLISKLIAIKGNLPLDESSLKIEKIYLGTDNKAKWGDNIRVKVNIYKGNTTKYSVKLYLENSLSKQTLTNIDEKFTDYALTIPLQIVPNCNQKYKDGSYKLILEGLDDKDEQEISISGTNQALCQEIKESNKKETKSTTKAPTTTLKKYSYSAENNINDSLSGITGNVIYESSDIKTNRYALYFFSAVLILLIIQLVTEKNAKSKNNN